MKHWNIAIAFLFVSAVTLAQSYMVRGKVVDQQNEPLTGVAIMEKGTTNGTITDLSGNYSIKVSSGTQTLQFTYLGYKMEEVRVTGNSKVVNVNMEEDNLALEEVQVVAYGQQKKVTLTGAVSSIGSTELLKVPVANIGNALVGQISGVSAVQYSGQPGADNPEIYVRGIGTLNTANATPLMLVDGVERAFFQLDPNEVESITVLKDASATAVFGVRGANGVILVTTKRGEEGPASIKVTSSFGIQNPTRILKLANSYQYALYHNEANSNDGKPLQFSDEALDAFRTGSNPLIYPDTDWLEMIVKPMSAQTQHNINISGGTSRVKYFTSVGFLFQDGMFRTFDVGYNSNFYYNRYNYRTNLDIDVTKTTRLSVNVGGRLEERNRPNDKEDFTQLFRHIYWSTPFSGAGIVDGKWIKKSNDYVKIGNTDGLDYFYGRGYSNNSQTVLDLDFVLTQKLDFITKGLDFKIKGSYNGAYDQTKSRSSSMPAFTAHYLKDLLYITDTPPGRMNDIVFKKAGDVGTLSYGESFGKSRNWYSEAGLNYQRTFNQHSVSALLLYNQSRRYYPAAFAELPTGYVGLVGRITYDYNTTYMFDINMGYNGSENFAPGRRYGFFPAASVGWVLTQEKFMKSLLWVNYLKVRASYGKVGNDKDGSNRFYYLPDQWAWGGGYNFGTNVSSSQSGAYEGKVGNPYTTWETAAKQNYGLDFSVFNSNLTVNFDYFIEKRTGILTSKQTDPGFLSVTMPTINLGVVDNEGFETLIKWNKKLSGKFRYWVNTTLSYSKNKIVFNDEIPKKYDYEWRTGNPVGQPFGLKFRGFYYNGMPDVADHSFNLKEGDAVYADLNKDGVITGEDEMAIGYPNYPLFTGGVTVGMRFKNLDFSMMWTGSALTSRILQETFRKPMGDTNDRSLMQIQYDLRWTPENREGAVYPRASFDATANNYNRNTDLWMRDASYLRLKNLELGLNVNNKFTKSLKMKQMRVYVNGYNLLTFDKLKLADPETRTSDRPTHPVMRIVNLGLNINF